MTSFRLLAATSALVVLSMPAWAASTAYVDTSMQSIKAENLGIYCRPTEKLSDGRLMVYNTSESDAKLLRKRMLDSGVSDNATLDKWQQLAQSNDCTNRAGLNCSGGTCSSGSCTTVTVNGFNGCECR